MKGQNDINQLPVVSDGHLEGVFSGTHVLRFLQAHADCNTERLPVSWADSGSAAFISFHLADL